MENPEEILAYLEEFTKLNSNHIPRELEEYLCFVAKTGDPVYQWSAIKTLFRQKLINVITEFYESCPSVDIPPCPNVDLFNYDRMKNFILEKLDTFAAAPFTVQRICELLTTPRKEYNRIDKYMRALEKNILVVSTREPGNRRATENGEGIVNGLESEHNTQEVTNSEINVEVDMEESASPSWPKTDTSIIYHNAPTNLIVDPQSSSMMEPIPQPFATEMKPDISVAGCTSSASDTVITCQKPEEPYVSIEPVIVLPSQNANPSPIRESEIIVTITADPIVKVKPPEMDVPVTNSECISAETTAAEAISPSVITESDQEPDNSLDSTTTTPQLEPSTPEITSSNSSEENLPKVAVMQQEQDTSEIPTSSESAVSPAWKATTTSDPITQPETSDIEPETSDMKVSEIVSTESVTSDLQESDTLISSSDEIAPAVETNLESNDLSEIVTPTPISIESGNKKESNTSAMQSADNEAQTEVVTENEVQTDYQVAASENKVEESLSSTSDVPSAMEVDELLPDASAPVVSASE